MSAASRTTQTAPSTRAMGATLLAFALLFALATLLAYGPLAAAKPQAPAAGAAPVVHDHGWSSASTSTRAAIDAGRHRPKTRVVPAAGSGPAGIVVKGAHGGGIVYTGIPYPAPGAAAAGSSGNTSSTRVRLAR